MQASAQGVFANVHGTVRSADGTPIAGARVALLDEATGWSREAISTEGGTYELRLVPAATYFVNAGAEGWADAAAEQVTIGMSRDVRLDLVLRRLAVQAQVLVVAATPLVETRRSELGGIVWNEIVEAAPVDARDTLNLMYLVPGTLPARRGSGYDQLVEVAVGSQQGQDNVVRIDGADVSDPTIGFAGFGAPLDATQEFEVLSNRYTARYGGGSGAIVNILTKSGGNRVRGSAFAVFTDETLRGSEPFAAEDASSHRRWQAGMTLGGPMVADRAHWFAAYDGWRADLSQAIDTGGTFPELEGAAGVDRDRDQVLAKVTLQSGDSHFTTARYQMSRLADANFPFGLPSQSITDSSRIAIEGRTDSLLLSDAWTIGANSYNEARLHYFASDFDFRPNSTAPWEIRPSSFQGGFPFFPQGRTDRRWQLASTLSILRTAHSFAFGFDAQSVSSESLLSVWGGGGFIFGSDARFDPADPTTFPVVGIQGYTQETDRSLPALGVFVSDDWSLSDRLTLNLGLRWDLEDGSLNGDVANPVPWLSRPPLDTNNVQLRTGFAYDDAGDGETILRGGYGRYHTRLYQWLQQARSLAPGLRTTINPPFGGHENPNGTFAFEEVTIFGTDPSIRTPFTDQFSLGLDHRVGRHWAVGVDYVHRRGRNEILQIEGNPISNGEQREHPTFGSVPLFASVGASRHDGLTATARTRSSRVSLSAAYTLSWTRNDHDYIFDFVESPSQLEALWGASLNDTRHRLVVSGAWEGPASLSVGAVVTLSSAQPIYLNTGMDGNFDGRLDPPAGAQRNAGHGDPYQRIDLRLSRPLVVGTLRLEPLLEIFNLFDSANVDPDTVQGNLNAPTFGKGGETLHPLYQPRQLQVGLRIRF